MQYLQRLCACLVIALCVAGCAGDDDTMSPAPIAPAPGPATPPAQPAVTALTLLTRQILGSTAEDTEPVILNAQSLLNMTDEGDPQPVSFYRP